MKKSHHTPGPWEALETRSTGWYEIEQSRKYNTIGAAYGNGKTVKQNAANGSLMAAAPDMYEALKNLLEIGKRDLTNEKYNEYFVAAKAAIALAEKPPKKILK